MDLVREYVENIIRETEIYQNFDIVQQSAVKTKDYIDTMMAEGGLVPTFSRIKTPVGIIKKMIAYGQKNISFVNDILCYLFIEPNIEACYDRLVNLLDYGFIPSVKLIDTLKHPTPDYQEHRSLDLLVRDEIALFELQLRTPELETLYQETHAQFKDERNFKILRLMQMKGGEYFNQFVRVMTDEYLVVVRSLEGDVPYLLTLFDLFSGGRIPRVRPNVVTDRLSQTLLERGINVKILT